LTPSATTETTPAAEAKARNDKGKDEPPRAERDESGAKEQEKEKDRGKGQEKKARMASCPGSVPRTRSVSR
jgi:hypothetical protein